MSRKPRRASPSARPTSADTLFRQLPTVEHTAYLVLNALDHVVDVAGRFAPGAKRIEFGPDLADVPERDRPTELSLPTRPVHGLLAACIAFVQTEFWGHLPESDLDIYAELSAARRGSVVALSGRKCASALGFIGHLAPFPLGEDFRVHQVVARIKYLLTDDPDLWFDGPWGSSTPIDDRPGLRDGYYELARALACGFGRTEPHPDAPLADRPRLLARLMAEDEELSGLIGRVAARKLADHVGRRLTREDIDTLREEVRLEFAGLSSWGSEFRKRVASLQAFSGAGGRPRGRDYSPTELRRLQFAYELVCDLRIGLKDGVEKFREREEREKDWYPISSIPGLTDAARRYALHSGKPLPPKRRGN